MSPVAQMTQCAVILSVSYWILADLLDSGHDLTQAAYTPVNTCSVLARSQPHLQYGHCL